jgi:predicted alpha-1,6-mannanase (GH76 family)
MAVIVLLSILLVSALAADTRCQQAVETLQKWYNTGNGVWNTTGWWNSGNALTATIDYMQRSNDHAYISDLTTTYAKGVPPGTNNHNFTNDYYDDEGWWAMAWLDAYDLTGNTTYLSAAEYLHWDTTYAWDTVCGGGVWWDRSHSYKNAIPNELFFALGARLYLRTGNSSYLTWAQKTWNWFEASGMINSQNLINDGLDKTTCKNNGQTTWSYNQGVILGGLADLAKATGNNTLVTKAQAIASAAIKALSNSNGILVEPCEPNCGGDGPQFKGIFMRYLYYLVKHGGDPSNTYVPYLQKNADSIWNSDRNGSNQLGLKWAGPFDSADASRQSSALDALNGVCFG